MAAPAWGSSSETHSTGAAISAPAPASTAQNDLLLAFVLVDVNTPTVTTVGSGYTLVEGPVQGSAGDERCWVYKKLAGASEGNTTWGLSVTNRNWSVILCRITGVDTTTPVNASANRSGTASTSQAVAQPTSTVGDCLAISFTTSDMTSVTPPWYTPPSGTLAWTERLDAENTGSNQAYGVATAVLASASQVPADTWTLGASDSAPLITVLVAPAAGGVTGTAAGAFGFTGSAAGTPRTAGAAAGSFGFTATAAGVDRVLGTAGAGFGFTGSAAGTVGSPTVLGSGVAAFGFTGTAQGVPRTPGSAFGALGFTGSALGVDRALGAAVASLGFTGSGTGQPRTFGTAATSLGFTGAAAGVDRALGVALAPLGFTGSASGIIGNPPVTGMAAATFNFTGSAQGQPRTFGAATAAFGFAANAYAQGGWLVAYNTFTLTGTYKKPNGTADKGGVVIVPSVTPLVDSSGKIILAGAVTVQLDSNGAFSVVLPTTGADLLPASFGYTLLYSTDGHGSGTTSVTFTPTANGTTLNVADIVPAPLPAVVTPTAVTQAGLDGAVQSLVNDVASASRIALSAAYAARQTATITAAASADTALTIEAAASPTADILRVKDGNGTVQVKVTSGNTLYAPQIRAEGTQVGTVPLVIEGASGLTADIAKFRAAPGGTDLAWITKEGRVRGTNLTELIFNVKDYGAKGDGSTSDTTNIQSAITAATTAGGGVVYFPPGTYMINAFVGLKDKVSMRGAGADVTVLKAKTGLTTGILVGATADTVSDLTISDLTVDGDYAGTAASLNGIQITTASRVTIRDCGMKNLAKMGVLIQTDSAEVTVSHCRITDTGLADAANGFGVRILKSQRCKVLKNRITGARGMGINAGDTGANASLDTEIDGNYIDMSSSTTYEAIGVTADCLRTIIRGNHVVNSMDNGISCTASESVVTGNTVNGAQNSGIYLGGSNCVCTGNFVKNAGQEVSGTTFGGVTIGGGTQNVVTGNRCYDDQGTKTQDYGVKESSPGDYNLISGNVLRGNLTAAVSTSGANTVSTGNIT